MITIALDAMGGDHGPSVVIPAALQALKRFPQLILILVGDETIIKSELSKAKVTQHERLQLHHTSQIVGMDEAPAHALRTKKDSSMRVAINLVKQGLAQACVSAGNTGALMATARFVLKTLPGIDRPAIISELPTATAKTTRLLDLGANVDSSSEHLFQFAVMGSTLAAAVDNIPSPTVGLLNIGEEDIKGNDQVKHTSTLLGQCAALNYIGYVEGDDIFRGTADVVVADGFVGNVALKTSEGVAKLIAKYIKEAFTSGIWGRFAGLIAWPVLRRLRKTLDPARYNGASLVGLNGIVIKSHGGANVIAFRQAIMEAVVEVEENVPQLIREQLANILESGLEV